jgi:hypothetical protein
MFSSSLNNVDLATSFLNDAFIANGRVIEPTILGEVARDIAAAVNLAAPINSLSTSTPIPTSLTEARVLAFSLGPLESKRGIIALESLTAGITTSIGSSNTQREILFWLSAALLQNGELSRARVAAVTLTQSNIHDERAAALLEIIKGRVKRKANEALTLVVGVAAVSTVLFIFISWTIAARRARSANASSTTVVGSAISAVILAAHPHGVTASEAIRKGGRGVGREVGAAVGAAVEDGVIAARSAIEDAWRGGKIINKP